MRMRKCLVILILSAAAAGPALGQDLSLRQAIDLALRQNRTIQASRYKLDGAEAGVMAARGSLVPQLAASGSMMRLNSLIDMKAGQTYYLPVLDGTTHAPTSGVVPMSAFSIASDKIGNTYAGKLSATWPVYAGGRIWQGYQISRLARDAVKQEYDTTAASVVLAVTQAYYDLLLARQALAVTQEAVGSIEKHVSRVQALYDKGMVSKLDLLRVRVQLSNLQPLLIRMENAADLAAQSFNLVLGRDLSAVVTLSDSMCYQPVTADSAGLVARALANRPELRQVDLARRIARKARLISWAGYQPSVVLLADYSTSKGQGFSGGDAWQKNWDVGVAASWTLFDGLGTAGRIRQAAAAARQLQVTRDQVENYVRLDVTANYLTLKANERAILSQRYTVEQAQEAFRMSQARYESGQATNLDVLDASLALSQARTNSIQAVHDYLLSLAKLEKAVGQPVR
jgi:outer membrane protein